MKYKFNSPSGGYLMFYEDGAESQGPISKVILDAHVKMADAQILENRLWSPLEKAEYIKKLTNINYSTIN